MLRSPNSKNYALQAVLVGVAVLAFGCAEQAPERPLAPPRPAAEELHDQRLAERIEKQVAHLHHRPQDATRWRDLGLLYHAHNLFDLAAQCYDQSLQLAPEEARPLFHLAQVERRLGKPGAREHLEQVAALNGYTPAWWHLALWRLEDGDTVAAQEAAQHAHAMEPNSRSALLVRARIEQQIGQPQVAADLLRDHLKAHPQDNDAHQLLGRALQRLGRSAEAAPHLELGQGAEGVYGDPWSNAINTLQTHFAAALRTASDLLGENPQRAVEKLKALHEERPENATALTNLGIGYRRLGRLEDSLMALKEVVQRHPGRGLAHFHLAATCLELLRIPADSPSPEILQSAFRHIDRALGLQPTAPRNHALRAEILVLAGRTPEAIQAYTQAVAREPMDLAWLPRLGTLLCELHRFREAISVLERHRRRAGDSADVLLLLGVAKANSGLFEEAAETLEQARLLSPHDPSILQALEQLRKVRPGFFSQAIDS